MAKIKNPITIVQSGGGAVLGTKSITTNGTYNASSDNLDGYSSVTVNVPQSVNKLPLALSKTIESLTASDFGTATTFPADLFYGCQHLRSVEFSSSITTIPQNGFRYCYALSSLTIPTNITTIGRKAFDDCSGLQSITFLSNTPPICNDNIFLGTTCPIYVPYSADHSVLAAYKDATNLVVYASRMQESPAP